MESVSRVCSLPGCTRPCFREGSIVHPYCSRTHANEALEMGMQASLGASGASFKMCRLKGCSKEVHVDRETGHVYDFCGRRHAKLAKSCRNERLDKKGTSVCRLMECEQTVYRDPVTGKESEYCSNKHFMIGEANRSKECIRKDCSRPAWIEEDTGHLLAYCGSECADAEGSSHLVGKNQCSLPGCVRTNMVNPHTKEDLGYCSEDHRLRATQRFLGPVSEPFVDRTFRGGTTSATDFELSVLTKLHPNYASIKEQFLNKWVKSEPAGGVSVVRIFKIKSPEDVRVRHEGYRGIVSNVVRRFHGTSCSSICTFFVDLRGGPCGETNCNVCNICTHGFRLGNNVGRTARKTNFNLRYGHGLYFSSISGKANDYAVEAEKTNKSGKLIRCMFMASVAVGKAFKTTEGILDSSQCPPPGYDSVVGEVGPALNYDELVVYKPEAALPTYLISYVLNH